MHVNLISIAGIPNFQFDSNTHQTNIFSKNLFKLNMICFQK